MGILFANVLSIDDKKLVYIKLTNYFNNLKDDVPVNYLANLIYNLKNNFFYLLVIWILGISIIGLLVNNFIVFFKSFILGFSIGSIINIYLYAGIILSILYIFPALLINLLILIMMTYYANDFSLKLYELLFKRKEIKFNSLIQKYLKQLGVFSIILLISTVFETFITPIVIKLFSFLIK